jgi:hypothetical protein
MVGSGTFLIGDWARVLLQTSGPAEPAGVSFPIVPLLVAVVALAIIAAIVAAAFLKPVATAVARRRDGPKRHDVRVQPSPPPAPVPLLKKAPVRIQFPQIRERFPDVWGVGQSIEISFRITDKALGRTKEPEGLSVRVGGEDAELSFSKGQASGEWTFKQKGPVHVTVEYRNGQDQLPMRTTRTLRVVDYREEIAEVFHKFRDEASRAITPVASDATPREVLDILTDANPRLPVETVRRIVDAFEVAKFSNHPVTREDYERMIEALLDLERVEL